MDRESVNRLRFDRRLEQRSGWAEDADREANIESLPDLSDKMTRGLDEEETQDDVEGEAPNDALTSEHSQPTPPPPASGGFNPPGGFSGGGSELS